MSRHTNKNYFSKTYIAAAIVTGISGGVIAAEANDAAIEEVVVVSKSVSFANSASTDAMMKQQSAMTSVLSVIDNLPGVLINEGDTFGADDWSTSISIRGFQVDLGQQQIGITIDGIANGNSNYGGGAKANRYIDSENLALVEVFQGTADVSSRSNEALGGTLNFTTIEPGQNEQLLFSLTLGEFDAQKYFIRYETGEIAKDTYAWISASTRQSSDWMDQVAENVGDHFAAKIISKQGIIDFTGYFSYDDAHEDNYQRIYGLEQFAQNPEWDQLTSEWSGTPYIDQAYRRGWSTLRENLFAYVEADVNLDSLSLSFNTYFHNNTGRGDWLPPYLVDVTNEGVGNANAELSPNTIVGGAPLGNIYFVSPLGETLAADPSCESSLTFPYGGGGPEYDPACYTRDAVPVGSYRHTHYEKQRFGINGDFVWNSKVAGMDNALRGGFWYEDYTREESRDWHKIIDAKTSFQYDHRPYWIQYDREFPVETSMFYLENEISLSFADIRIGAKKFNVDVEKQDNIVSANVLSVSSDSDVLFSAGIVAPINPSIELFAGYSENFAAIKDAVLERDDTDLRFIEPETAENIDLGLRYFSEKLDATLTFYDIQFDNRVTFISNEDVDGIDFLETSAGGYINDGGVESKGLEASINYTVTQALSVFFSYTNNSSEYTDADIAGQTVIGVADDMFALSFDWQRDNYSAGLSTKFVGERFLDQANTQEVDSYVVADFYLGTSITNVGAGLEGIEVRMTINNLFDKRYLGTIAPGAAWIGAPRTAAINMQLRF